MFAATRVAAMRRVPSAAAAMRRTAAPMRGAGVSSLMAALRFLTERADVRNIAVIAHVDHGKTTLVDGLLKFSGTLSEARNRVMDSNDQEKERGITILAKNTAIVFPDGRRVNVVDTPGHLDFSGEVERSLQMVEGFILLVDAAEGVRPGTRYVLRKALTLGLRPIICINKIDKEDEKIDKVVEQVQELFLETVQDADQLEQMFFLYGSGRDGYFNLEPKKGGTLDPLFKAMFEQVPPPKQEKDDAPLQMLVALVDETKTGKVAIGRIFKGSVKKGDIVKVVLGDANADARVEDVRLYRGIEKVPVEEAQMGDLVWMELKEPRDTTIPLKIGASVCNPEHVDPWPYQKPDQPTFTLKMKQSDAPWAGKEIEGIPRAKMLELRERLRRELLVNQALQIDDVMADEIVLRGRGPLHLSVLIEGLRREGYEFELCAPSVVRREIDGEMCEPFERITMEYPQANASDVMSLITQKHGEVVDINNVGDDRLSAEVTMPVRLMTDLSTRFNRMTGGRGVLNHVFDGYKPEVPVDSNRATGTMVALEDGTVEQYSLAGLTVNGRFFVMPGEQVYYGQIVGENTKVLGQDMPVNVCKKTEQQGGMRASAFEKEKRRGKEFDATSMTLEDYFSWVTPEELITVTPKSIRARLPAFQGKTIQRNKTGGAGAKGGKKKK